LNKHAKYRCLFQPGTTQQETIMSSILNGGCLCGAVRYRVHGQPFHVTHCHCVSCRKASGAAFLTWFTVRLIELEWLSEKPVYYHSSTAVQRGFCPHCGATLSYQHESDPDDIDITRQAWMLRSNWRRNSIPGGRSIWMGRTGKAGRLAGA
jgi:hypothetical protein